MFSTFVGLGRFINCQRPEYVRKQQKRKKYKNAKEGPDRTENRPPYKNIISEEKRISIRISRS